jgi:hypothetical protein
VHLDQEGVREEIEAEYRDNAEASSCTVERAEKKRAEYISRMEDVMRGLDAIIADPSGYEEIQVRAVNSLVSAVRMCYRMVVDVEVERLEDELVRLEEENRHMRAARGELGYEVEG